MTKEEIITLYIADIQLLAPDGEAKDRQIKWLEKKLETTKTVNVDLGDIIVSDEEIEKESQQRYGEVLPGGMYLADRPENRKCFIKGAKWMRGKLDSH